MRLTTIDEVRAVVWKGNHYRDGRMLDKVAAFVSDSDQAMGDRVEALQIMDRAMGEQPSDYDTCVKDIEEGRV